MAKNIRYYEGKYFQGTLSDEQCSQLLALQSEDFKSVPSLKHCITDVPDWVITDIISDAESYEREHGTLEGFSKDYSQYIGVGTLADAQTIGVAFMFYAESALLGDEVGLGKTVQVAGLINVLKKLYRSQGKEFTFCFLTEKSSVGQIRNKLIRFTGEYVGLLESGEKAVFERYLRSNRDKRHYGVVGCHSLLLNPDFLTYAAKYPYDLIVVDESSILKNSTSEYYLNARALFKFHKRKILLNATPLEIHLREFYNQLNLLDEHFLPTVTEFEKRYVKRQRGVYGFKTVGYKNQEEFKEAISLRYLSRTRRGLGAKYEGNVYRTILVPLSPEQRELNKKTSLYRLVTDYPTKVNRNVPFTPETTPKLAVLLHILEETVGTFSSQALVYCSFVEAQQEMARIIEEQLGYKVAVLNGQGRTSNAKVRTEVVEAFNNGVYDVLITNVLRGLDLKTCDNCILYSIDPNPQKMVQFEGRITREFDIYGKSVWLLVAMGKEKKFVEQNLKLRVNASASFTNTGKSLVLTAINSDDNKALFVPAQQYSPESDEEDTEEDG